MRSFLQPLSQGRHTVSYREGMDIYQHVMDGIHYMDILCKDKAYGYQLGVKRSLFHSLLGLLSEDNIPARGGEAEKIRGENELILEYIENHYGENYREDRAALCFTVRHFMKYFKKYMGMPFIQYLNDYRLEKGGRISALPCVGDGRGPAAVKPSLYFGANIQDKSTASDSGRVQEE